MVCSRPTTDKAYHKIVSTFNSVNVDKEMLSMYSKKDVAQSFISLPTLQVQNMAYQHARGER